MQEHVLVGILSRSTLQARLDELEEAASPQRSMRNVWAGCVSLDTGQQDFEGVHGSSPKAFFRTAAAPQVRIRSCMGPLDKSAQLGRTCPARATFQGVQYVALRDGL